MAQKQDKKLCTCISIFWDTNCGIISKMRKELKNPEFDNHGYIQVYTGNGKGKTTASLGLALRALGRGWDVLIVMLTKGGNDYGEQSWFVV